MDAILIVKREMLTGLVQNGYKPHHHDCHHHCFGVAHHRRHLQQVQMSVQVTRAFSRLAFGAYLYIHCTGNHWGSIRSQGC
jgi:hypothetical protein